MIEVTIPKNFKSDLVATLSQAAGREILPSLVESALVSFIDTPTAFVPSLSSVEVEEDNWSQWQAMMALIEAGQLRQAKSLLQYMDRQRPEVLLMEGILHVSDLDGKVSSAIRALELDPTLIFALANLTCVKPFNAAPSIVFNEVVGFPHDQGWYHSSIGYMRPDLRGILYQELVEHEVQFASSFHPYLPRELATVDTDDGKVVCLIDGTPRVMVGHYVQVKHQIDKKAYMQFFGFTHRDLVPSHMRGKGGSTA